jgi:hypothetical protein
MIPAQTPPIAGDQQTAALDDDQITALAQLLTQIDEFLRSSTGDAQRPADLLAAFLSTGPGDTGQAAANCLIDNISFTAYNLRHQQ